MRRLTLALLVNKVVVDPNLEVIMAFFLFFYARNVISCFGARLELEPLNFWRARLLDQLLLPRLAPRLVKEINRERIPDTLTRRHTAMDAGRIEEHHVTRLAGCGDQVLLREL